MRQSDLEIQDYTTTVTILESITDAIFILNADRRIEYANRSAQSALQRPLAELIGAPFSTFILSGNGGELESLDQPHEEPVRSKQPGELFGSAEVELKGLHHNIPVLINLSSIPDNLGQIKYIIATAKEIAYRKGLEKELKQRQALSVSFDRLKALGEMSVGLVHTLGQPVTSMELRLEYIKRLTQDAAIHEQVQHLQEDIEQLARIVTKVRNYALVSDGRQTRQLDLNNSIRTALQVLDYDVSKARVELSLTLTDSLPTIQANAPELEQVVINLVGNALEAFEAHEITVHRRLHIQTSSVDGKWVLMSIIDNAGGIDPATRDKIFDPFFSTWENEQHAGTGLSVARSILSSLGGDLQYFPEERGSNFQLRIPVEQNEERTQLFNLIELLNSA